MGTIIYIPKMGANISTALVVKLYAKKGDHVKKKDILFDVETEKAVFSVEAETEGILLSLDAQEGKRYSILDEVGFIGEEHEVIPKLVSHQNQIPIHETTSEIKATPSAKKLATEHGIDISLAFKGIQKIIKESDVSDYISSLSNQNATSQDIPPRKRVEIGIISHNKEYVVSSVTVSFSSSKLKKAILRAKEEHQINISAGEYLSYLAAKALGKFPLLNSYYHGEKFMIYKTVNLGFAVNVDRELLVPVIQHAGTLSLKRFCESYRGFVMKAVKNELTSEDMGLGTFTVSDLSSENVFSFQPLINAKQSAILGIGSEYDSCAEQEGKLTYDRKINLTLSFDHRISDGKYAAEFLNELVSF